MEQKKAKFRLHLNLFDCIVIVAALAAAVFLLWSRLKPQDVAIAPASVKIQYTICLQKVLDGTGELVQAGDELVDSVKNYDLGQVVSVEVLPATKSIVDEGSKAYVTAEIPGYEDLMIQVVSTASYSDDKILVGSGYELRVGENIYVRGPGYMGSGTVRAIERGE